MISILIPTKGRPDRLKACVESIDIPCEILVLATCANDVPTSILGRVDVFYDSTLTIIQAQNLLASEARGHVLPICDDVEFDPGSLAILEEAIRYTQGWSAFGLNVTNMDHSKYGFMCIGRRLFIDEMKGILFHKGYKHFYADTELGEMLEDAKHYKFLEDCTLNHYHPTSGSKKDKTHTDGRTDKLQHDSSLYRKRKEELAVRGFLHR